jgi:hypothetical protein
MSGQRREFARYTDMSKANIRALSASEDGVRVARERRTGEALDV